MNFALLCQGEKSNQTNRKRNPTKTCCEKDSLTCMSTGTKRGVLRTSISRRGLALLADKPAHAGEMGQLYLGPRPHLTDDLRRREASELPRRLEIEIPGQAEKKTSRV